MLDLNSIAQAKWHGLHLGCLYSIIVTKWS